MSDAVVLTTEMLYLLGILALTVVLFVTEIVRVDIAAVCIVVLLGLMVTGISLGATFYGYTDARHLGNMHAVKTDQVDTEFTDDFFASLYETITNRHPFNQDMLHTNKPLSILFYHKYM